MKKKILVANWKMNLDFDEAQNLISSLNKNFDNIDSDIEIIISPPYLYLSLLSESKILKPCAQNCFYKTSGAYTGEISPKMLKSINTKYVILGHSERRENFYEKNEEIFLKMKKALEYNIKPIYCCGETIDIRKNKNHLEYIKIQIQPILKLTPSEISKIIISYEPIWAIGTGVVPKIDQISEIHTYIKKILNTKFDSIICNQIPILYGGSLNETNSKEIFKIENVDGGLVGGSSLDSNKFNHIYQNLKEV